MILQIIKNLFANHDGTTACADMVKCTICTCVFFHKNLSQGKKVIKEVRYIRSDLNRSYFT